MRNNIKLYPINQCALYKCSSKKKLASLLNSNLAELKDLTVNIDKNYYNFYQDKKGTTDKRKITAPEEELKRLQKRVLSLLKKIEKPDWVMSSTLEKSYIDNAKYHLGASYFCKTDVKQFYDNCKRERVYRFFKDKLLTAPDIAKLLTNLVTINLKIPTGAPSSQLIAYFAYEDMFHSMHNIAQELGYKMTLYVDDLVFSRDDYADYKPLIRKIDIEARKYDHSLKRKKTRFYKGESGAPVTGVVVKKNEMHIPNNLRQGTITLFSEMKNSKDIDENQWKSLVGKINSARLIEKEHFNGMYSYIKNTK